MINNDFPLCKGKLLINEPLSNYTTYRTGGSSNQLYKPYNLEDLVYFLKYLPATESILWLGLGSNSLIRDNGFTGTIILTKEFLTNIYLISKNYVYAEAGIPCSKMSKFCANYNLSGGEFWIGIPGTIGGALRMNAGCYNYETWKYVVSVETINRYGIRNVRKPSDFNIDYRSIHGLSDEEWFISAIFHFPDGEKHKSLQKIKKILEYKRKTQPVNNYNCGSIFKNPFGYSAAQLIESCGLKGMTIGNAVVSTKHANFIINKNKCASSRDIELLIQYIQDIVLKKKNIQLICEVHIFGEYNE